MGRSQIPEAIQTQARTRAKGLCEYCHAVGLTDIGRATIAKLAMNRERVLLIREADREIGRHPPNGYRQLLP